MSGAPEPKQCKSCKYWRKADWHTDAEPAGMCRRRAPVAVTTASQFRFPITHQTEWCGEYYEAST